MKNTLCVRKHYSVLLFSCFIALTLSNTVNAQGRRGMGNTRERHSDLAASANRSFGNSNRELRRSYRSVERPAGQGRNTPAINNSTAIQPRRNNTTIVRNNTVNRPLADRGNLNSRPRSNNNVNTPTVTRPATTRSLNARPRYGSVNRPAYRPVYGYNRPVYSAVNPGWRYGFLPGRNSYFYSLPSTYININFGGFGYRYWNGVFYRPYNNLFTVVAPPVGIFINVLPVGYRTIYVRDYPYYYYNGTYYDKRDSDYYVVSPPVGAVVESLPAGYQTVVIDGETYYTIDGAQYKPVIKENGEIWYEVIKAN